MVCGCKTSEKHQGIEIDSLENSIWSLGDLSSSEHKILKHSLLSTFPFLSQEEETNKSVVICKSKI